MTVTPRELLETSIAQLRTLAAFLDDQLGVGGVSGSCWSPEVRACNEIRGSLRAFIPKLTGVRLMATRSENIERCEERDVS